MKRAALALAAVAAVGPAVGAAAAQEAPAPGAPVITRPNWVKKPSGADLAAVWPAEARARGIDGRAVIRCEVSVEGTLRRCGVIQETPPGSGYGFAALQLAPQFQMRPQSVDGKPVAGGMVIIPVTFQTGGPVNSTRSRLHSPDGVAYVAEPNWLAAPTRAQAAAAYSAARLGQGGEGRATLDCGVMADGRLRDCQAIDQAPKGGNLGRAAMSLAPLFRLEPPRDASGAVRRNVRVRFPVNFSPSLVAREAPQVVRPEWGRLPDAADVTFPAQAKAAGLKEGGAVLDCRVQPGGTLGGCSVARETPAGMGFGEAALKLAPAFAMKAWTSDGRPVDGARVRIPVRFEP